MRAPVFVEIPLTLPGARAFTSLEGENHGGSIKDRMVEGELRELLASGRLRAGDRVAEASAGSTALSLAIYGRDFGLHVVLFVPDNLPAPAQEELRALGAELRFCPLAAGMTAAYATVDKYCADLGIFQFNQLKDATKERHYRALGQAARVHGPFDAAIGAVGCGHSLIGVAQGLGVPAITAEPLGYRISGCRNLDVVNHGPDDPSTPARFSRRILISEAELTAPRVDLVFSDSFKIVLSAAERFARERGPCTLFLVGANCRRSG